MYRQVFTFMYRQVQLQIRKLRQVQNGKVKNKIIGMYSIAQTIAVTGMQTRRNKEMKI